MVQLNLHDGLKRFRECCRDSSLKEMGHLQDMHIIIQQDPKSLIGEEYRMVTQFPKKTKAGKLKGGHV